MQEMFRYPECSECRYRTESDVCKVRSQTLSKTNIFPELCKCTAFKVKEITIVKQL
jgi:hypothetical protein